MSNSLNLFQVLELSDNIKKQIPENIDYEQTLKIMMSDTSPLKTVLLQEVSPSSTPRRYQTLPQKTHSQYFRSLSLSRIWLESRLLCLSCSIAAWEYIIGPFCEKHDVRLRLVRLSHKGAFSSTHLISSHLMSSHIASHLTY